MKKAKIIPHRPLQWICDNLIFLPISGPKLSNQPVGKYLLSFQEKIITTALKEDGTPNKNIFLGYSRKISKSMMFSWLYNYLMHNKEGYSLVSMASTFSQSDIIYRLIWDQIRLNKKIDEKEYRKTLEQMENKVKQNMLQKIFSEASSNLGLVNVSALLADEIGAMKSRENLNSIMSGLALAQVKPLLLFASNRPERPSHWSIEYLNTLRKNDKWAFFDYSANMKLDPFSEQAKCEANPFYDEYVKTKNSLLKTVKEFVDEEAESAKKSAENLVVYRRFQLGQPVSSRIYQWVDVKDIQIASEKVFENKKLRVICCFDLSLVRDFCCCLIFLYNEKTEDIYLYPILHLANLKSRRLNQQKVFHDWSTKNYITIQDEEVVSKSIFIADVKRVLKEKGLTPEKYIWDRNLSTGWASEFSKDPVLYKGTAHELSHAIRFVEARSKEGKLHFIGENPCSKWMFDNAVCSQKSRSFTLLDRVSVHDSIETAVCCVLGAKYFIENKRKTFVGFALD